MRHGEPAPAVALYDRVRGIVADFAGPDVFLIYQALRDAVRSSDLIGDSADLEAAFVSTHADGLAAAAELKQIAFTLIEQGLHVRCEPAVLQVYDGADPTVRVQLFHLYVDDDGELRIPFGAPGTQPMTADDWRGTTEIDVAGRRCLLPHDTERMLEFIYGAGWRDSTATFDWDHGPTKPDWSAALPGGSVEEIYWANFYAHTAAYSAGSTFFELVNGRVDTPDTVIDIGCGDGRDSCGFAVSGRRVTGIDRSQVGLQHAANQAAAMGLTDRVAFRACDVADAQAFRAAVKDALADGDTPVLFYLRFFLHSITEEAQDVVMTVVAECARPGDLFAAEFRTDKDQQRTKVYSDHYRRFQSGALFGSQLRERFGFTVLDEQEGTGLAPYRDEDPEIYRVIARAGQ